MTIVAVCQSRSRPPAAQIVDGQRPATDRVRRTDGTRDCGRRRIRVDVDQVLRNVTSAFASRVLMLLTSSFAPLKFIATDHGVASFAGMTP